MANPSPAEKQRLQQEQRWHKQEQQKRVSERAGGEKQAKKAQALKAWTKEKLGGAKGAASVQQDIKAVYAKGAAVHKAHAKLADKHWDEKQALHDSPSAPDKAAKLKEMTQRHKREMAPVEKAWGKQIQAEQRAHTKPRTAIQTSSRGAKYYVNSMGDKIYVR